MCPQEPQTTTQSSKSYLPIGLKIYHEGVYDLYMHTHVHTYTHKS